MKTQSVKNFFISPFTVYEHNDLKDPLGKIKTWEKVVLVAFSILLIPTIIGAPLCLFLGSAVARRRNVQDLTFSSKNIRLHFPKEVGANYRNRQKIERDLVLTKRILKDWLSDSNKDSIPKTPQEQKGFFLIETGVEGGNPYFKLKVDCLFQEDRAGSYLLIKNNQNEILTFPGLEKLHFLGRLAGTILETHRVVGGKIVSLGLEFDVQLDEGEEGELPSITFTRKTDPIVSSEDES